MTEPLTLSLRERTDPFIMYPQSRSFGHCPKFMTVDEGSNVDRLVNREPHLLAQVSVHHCRRSTNLPANLLHFAGAIMKIFDSPFLSFLLFSSLP